ncbi:hypothetical protein [Chryseobacterium viscerum]|nr:hypothetical protein [Chryseobacterium viscerum]
MNPFLSVKVSIGSRFDLRPVKSWGLYNAFKTNQQMVNKAIVLITR